MIYFDKTEVVGWEHAIRGMRNPLNSWDKSDSSNIAHCEDLWCDECPHQRSIYCATSGDSAGRMPLIGPNDLKLMKNLAKAGASHRKYLRMITVYVDIIAPLYWWKEFDTYKVGTVANSCSTMHKIHAKEFTLNDFSTEHLLPHSIDVLKIIIDTLNECRDLYLGFDGFKHIYGEHEKKDYWWQMIQLLPTSYNQKRTVMLNYEVLANIYHDRKNHRLDEWVNFCEWIDELPYSELITGGKDVES